MAWTFHPGEGFEDNEDVALGGVVICPVGLNLLVEISRGVLAHDEDPGPGHDGLLQIGEALL
jgi:hypothetical protein